MSRKRFALLELGKSYRTKSGDVWHVFRQMGGLFAARRERDGVIEYFYPSGWCSQPGQGHHHGVTLRLRELTSSSTSLNKVTSRKRSRASNSKEAVLREPPESGTVTVGGEPSSSPHVTIERGAS